MKKLGFVLIFGLLILPLFLNGLNSANDSLGLNPEQIEETTTKITTLLGRTGEEWKVLLLENAFVKGMDSFFQEINIAFLVLFATDYSFSLELLFTVILWGYCLFFLYRAFSDFSLFSKGVSFVIALGLVMVMTHMKIIGFVVKSLMWLLFGEKEWWVSLIIGVIILFLLITLFMFLKKFGKKFKEDRQKRKDELNSMKLEAGAKVGEALSEEAGKGE